MFFCEFCEFCLRTSFLQNTLGRQPLTSGRRLNSFNSTCRALHVFHIQLIFELLLGNNNFLFERIERNTEPGVRKCSLS